MIYLKYVPTAIYALFVAFAFVSYSATGSVAVLLLSLGTGFVVGSWVAKSVEPTVAHTRLGKRLKRTRK